MAERDTLKPVELYAVQRYVSAVCWFMLRHEQGGGGVDELLAAKRHMEQTFGKRIPDFPDIL